MDSIRNPLFDNCQEGDILIEIDVDEALSIDDLKRSIEILQTTDCERIAVSYVNCWRDLQHTAWNAPSKASRMLKWSPSLRRSCYPLGNKFLGDEWTWRDPKYYIPTDDDIKLWHFGFVCSPRGLYEHIFRTHVIWHYICPEQNWLPANNEVEIGIRILEEHPAFNPYSEWETFPIPHIPSEFKTHPYYHASPCSLETVQAFRFEKLDMLRHQL